jgi:hypothetical protein
VSDATTSNQTPAADTSRRIIRLWLPVAAVVGGLAVLLMLNNQARTDAENRADDLASASRIDEQRNATLSEELASLQSLLDRERSERVAADSRLQRSQDTEAEQRLEIDDLIALSEEMLTALETNQSEIEGLQDENFALSLSLAEATRIRYTSASTLNGVLDTAAQSVLGFNSAPADADSRFVAYFHALEAQGQNADPYLEAAYWLETEYPIDADVHSFTDVASRFYCIIDGSC